MAQIATSLVDFFDNGNVRTYAAPAHSVQKPRLVQQRRKVAFNSTSTAETSCKVVFGTTDSESVVLTSKYSFEVVVRGPVNGNATDRDAAKALFREIIASDNFDAMVAGQLWIK